MKLKLKKIKSSIILCQSFIVFCHLSSVAGFLPGITRPIPMSHVTTHKHRESSYLPAYKATRPSTSVENVRQMNFFMQNKPNVKDAKMNVSSFITNKYVELDNWLNQTNKPNSNPIQTQSKPIQIQFHQRPKMNTFVWISSFMMIYCDFLAEFTTLKGAPNIAVGGANALLHKKCDLLHCKGSCVIGRLIHCWQTRLKGGG